MTRRAGFSLIELILAMSLATVLLAALWTAMDVHVRMFHGGQQDVISAQLGRALLRRIGDDIRTTIQPATPPQSGAATSNNATASTTGPTRLRGTARWIQIEVDQTAGARPAVAVEGERTSEAVLPAGLSLVTYFVRDATSAMPGASAIPTGEELSAELSGGLVRRELCSLYRDQLAAQERRPGEMASAGAADDEPPMLGRGGAADFAAEGPSPEVLLSPEVLAIEFRYFDGFEWLESWDSAAAGGLPRAIGVALLLSEAEGVGALADADPARGEENSAASARELRSMSLFEQSEEELSGRVYRLTIALAGAAGGGEDEAGSDAGAESQPAGTPDSAPSGTPNGAAAPQGAMP